MIRKAKAITFSVLRHLNKGTPTRTEVAHYIPLFQVNPHNIEMLWTMKLYVKGESVKDLAKDFGVTRERIRMRLIMGIARTKNFHDGMRKSLIELKALHAKKS